MRYDMINLWTDADVTSLEDALQRELGGEFVTLSDGRRSLLFGGVPGEIRFFVSRRRHGDGHTLTAFIDDRDENRSVAVQQSVALQVFEALARVTTGRLVLIAEDDTVIRDRPAIRVA